MVHVITAKLSKWNIYNTKNELFISVRLIQENSAQITKVFALWCKDYQQYKDRKTVCMQDIIIIIITIIRIR
jgi:hypothetical protein